MRPAVREPLLRPGEAIGAVAREARVGGVVLTETRYAPSASIAVHRHESFYFFLVLAGQFEEHRGAQRSTAIVSALRPGEPHGARVSGRARGFSVELTPSWSRFAWLRAARAAAGAAPHELALLLARLRQELDTRDAARALAVEGLALELAAWTTRTGDAAAERFIPPLLRRAMERLRADAEPPTCAALAEDAGLAPDAFARAFRRHVGASVGQFARRARLERARAALAGPRPLSELALAAGFYDQSHFTRQFKAAFGLPPSAYRRLHRRR